MLSAMLRIVIGWPQSIASSVRAWKKIDCTMPEPKLLITCEHAVNHVPDHWAYLFEAQPGMLDSHRGWDPGAWALAKALAADFAAPCIAAQVSRLLVDHNRSPHNHALWSEFSRTLPADGKETILNNYYHPFRNRAGQWIAERIGAGDRVVHISVHSFTPVYEGRVRDLEIGLLYDPGRSNEAFFADLWKTAICRSCEELRVRFNVPYRGRSDCHQTTYRNSYDCRDYVGIELEANQALFADDQDWTAWHGLLSKSLMDTLAEMSTDE